MGTGGQSPALILADQLTIFQSGGEDYAHQITTLKYLIEEHPRLDFSDFYSTLLAHFQPAG